MGSTTTLPLQTVQSLMSHLIIPNLQTILTFAGQNKYGQKLELQKRVMGLLKSNRWSKLIEAKILQIMREVNFETLVVNTACHVNSNCHSSCNHFAIINTPANRAVDSNVEIMEEIFMLRDFWGLYPEIEFKDLPFYEFLQEIVSPCTLIPERTLQDSCEFYCSFSLSSDVALKISSSLCTDIDNPAYGIELLLRICKLGCEAEYADDLPLCIDVAVNNQLCNLPSVISSTDNPAVLLKRFGAPIIITRQASTDFNNVIIIIRWHRRYVFPHAMAVHLVQKRDCEELLQKLQSKDVEPCSTTKTLIKQKMESDGDIVATSLKISLACPLGKMRMTLPCRAKTCQHFQCFDADAYLKMNKVRPTWLCPICNQACLFKDLIIDGYFLDILKSEKFKDSDDIWVYGDGTQIDLNKSSQNSTENKTQNSTENKRKRSVIRKRSSAVKKRKRSVVGKRSRAVKKRKRSIIRKRSSAAVISYKPMVLSSHSPSTSTSTPSSSNDLSTGSSPNKKLTPLLIDLANDDTEEPGDQVSM